MAPPSMLLRPALTSVAERVLGYDGLVVDE